MVSSSGKILYTLGLSVLLLKQSIDYNYNKFFYYKDIYETKCQAEGPQVSVVTGKLPDGIIGYCMPDEFQSVVILDEEYWAQANDEEKEEVMMHEMGHCVLGREHLEGTTNLNFQDVPKSLMKCCGLVGPRYYKYRDYYLKELFK